MRDWRRHGGLDLMLALGAEGELPPEGLGLLRSLFEMRASIGADAARLAALRADAAARAEIEAARRRAGRRRRPRRAHRDLRRALGPASSTRPTTSPTGSPSTRLVAGQTVLPFDASTVGAEIADGPAVRTLARAIAAGDADDRPRACASELLQRSIPEATS